MLKETLILEAVHREVVIEGKHLEEKDAFCVYRAISQGWILVQSVKRK
jgi:hypothetical protein